MIGIEPVFERVEEMAASEQDGPMMACKPKDDSDIECSVKRMIKIYKCVRELLIDTVFLPVKSRRKLNLWDFQLGQQARIKSVESSHLTVQTIHLN
jgi:hypothetical protein